MDSLRLGTGNEFGSLITMKIQILFSYTEKNKIKKIKNNHTKNRKKEKEKKKKKPIRFSQPKRKKESSGCLRKKIKREIMRKKYTSTYRY